MVGLGIPLPDKLATIRSSSSSAGWARCWRRPCQWRSCPTCCVHTTLAWKNAWEMLGKWLGRLVKFQLSRHRCGSSPASLACWVLISWRLGRPRYWFPGGGLSSHAPSTGAGGLDILPGELPIEHLDCINILLFNISVYITCCTCRYESIIPV